MTLYGCKACKHEWRQADEPNFCPHCGREADEPRTMSRWRFLEL